MASKLMYELVPAYQKFTLGCRDLVDGSAGHDMNEASVAHLLDRLPVFGKNSVVMRQEYDYSHHIPAYQNDVVQGLVEVVWEFLDFLNQPSPAHMSAWGVARALNTSVRIRSKNLPKIDVSSDWVEDGEEILHLSIDRYYLTFVRLSKNKVPFYMVGDIGTTKPAGK